MKTKALMSMLFFLSAQPIVADVCDPVYSSATRDLVIDVRNKSSLFTIYDQHCESSGEVSSSSVGLGLDVIVKQIPVEFTGTYGSSNEAMSNFCRNYNSERFSSQNSNIVRDTVVVEALRLYNDCKALHSQGVNITHMQSGPGSLAISIARTGTETRLVIQGVDLGPNVSCGSSSLGSNGVWTVVNETTHVSVDGNASILCKRQPVQIGDANEYPISWVTLATNLGNYGVKLQPESVVGGVLAKELSDKVKGNEDQIESLHADAVALGTEISAIRDEMAKIKSGMRVSSFRFYTGEYGGSQPDVGDRYDPRDWPDPNAIGRRYCPEPGSMSLSVVSSSSGGCCGYTYFVGTCVSYD